MGCCITWFLEGYLSISSRRPCLVMSVWSLAAIGFVVFGWLLGGIPEIEESFHVRSDGIVADRYDALNDASREEIQRRTALERRLEARRSDMSPEPLEESVSRHLLTKQRERWFADWHVDIIYEAVGGDVFDLGVLYDIHTFETRLEMLPSYKKFCLGSRRILNITCRGLRSAVRFFYGVREDVPSDPAIVAYEIIPNGSQVAPNKVGLVRVAMQEKQKWPSIAEPVGRMWYFDNTFPNSRFMRSTIAFGKPLAGFSHVLDSPEKQRELNEEFLANELFPFLQDSSTGRVNIYYQGSYFFYKYEFTQAVLEDAKKAIASLILVYIYMAAYMRAPLIAIFGMTTMILSVPMAMVIFKLSGHPTMPALNFLALFLLTGIGADNLFILIDAWRQTKRDFRNLKSRLRLTFVRAGSSLTACGTTTAMSFFANMFSSVRLLRWFGVFVGLCVLCNLLLCLAMFPPLLLLRERTKRRKVKVDKVAKDTSSSVIVVQSAPSSDEPDALSKKEKAPNEHWLSQQEFVTRARESEYAVSHAAGRSRSCCRFCRRRANPDAFNVSAFTDIGVPEPVQTTKRLKRGEHYYGELYAPEDEAGKSVPFNWAESFFSDIYAPVLKRWYPLILFIGVAITITNCILVSLYMEPSREFPVLFKPGTHNLGDVPVKREAFGNAPWTSSMEAVPLRICEGCRWDQSCQWGAWSVWTTCCKGQRLRSRLFEVPPGPMGTVCLGSHTQQKACQGSSCPIMNTTTSNIVTTATTTVAATTVATQVPLVHAAGKKFVSVPVKLPPDINPNLADSDVAHVYVVFGLKVLESSHSSDSFQYDSNFNIEDPATQILLSQLCYTIEGEGNLLAVRRSDCLIHAFQEYLQALNESFPVVPGYRFHGLLDNFITSRGTVARKKWRSHTSFLNGSVQFMKLEIITNLPRRMPGMNAWEWALRWDAFISSVNTKSAQTLPHCFHTSNLWVMADAERQLINSTIMCALASISFATCAVFWFLADILLSLILMFTVVCIILSLAALMFTVFGWSFGAIEAVTLIIVVGFSVDYSLHIAESYSQSSESSRYLRVQDALRRTGGALLGAAATSVLACPPILFCTMTVFVQFGLTLIANMLLAFVFSTLFFTASLVAVGPMHGSCNCRTKSSSSSAWSSPIYKLTQRDGAVACDDARCNVPSKLDRSRDSHHSSTSLNPLDESRIDEAWTHLSEPTHVQAPTRSISIGQSPHMIGQTAWQEAEQPGGPPTQTKQGSQWFENLDDCLS